MVVKQTAVGGVKISSPPPGDRSPRFRALDGLRFIAALTVLVFHFTARESDVWGAPVERVFPTVSPWTAYGTLGVELFFIVSGFVILMTAWGKPLSEFTASRVARLFPAYWCAVAVTAALLILVWPEGRQVTVPQALVNLTMMQDAFDVGRVDGVYWTLWAELRFYLLIGCFMLIGITRNRVLAFCALWPLVGGMVATTDSSPLLETILLPRYAPLFAGGMMIYFIYREGHSLLAWLIVGANAVLGAHQAAVGAVGRIDGNTAYEHVPAVVWLAVLSCFALVAATALTRLRNLRWGWLTALGALTYPLYLIHEYWGRWLIHLLAPQAPKHLVLVVVTLFCVGLAYLIHRLVERRFAAALRRAVQGTLESAGHPQLPIDERARTAGQPPFQVSASMLDQTQRLTHRDPALTEAAR